MRTLGIDPSYRSTGIALVIDLQIVDLLSYRPKGNDLSKNIYGFQQLLDTSHITNYLDSICIERISVTRNLDAVRKISYVEGLAISFSGQENCDLRHMNVTSARKLVFGKGDISKEIAYEMICDKFKNIDFDKFNKSGSDQTDAAILGLAFQIEKLGYPPIFNL